MLMNAVMAHTVVNKSAVILTDLISASVLMALN